MQRSKGALFWPVVLGLLVADYLTKALAVRHLVPQRVPHEVFGDAVRFTLVYNPGAAFGLGQGFAYSRWFFLILTILALGILGWLYRTTAASDRQRTLALALVCSGAVGNLVDRVRHDLGVVDFIDVGIGASRWPTFNIADIAISVGAGLLALVLWRDDREVARDGARDDGVHPASAATPRVLADGSGAR